MNSNSPDTIPKLSNEVTQATRVRNFLIAIAAIALTIALSLGLRSETNSVSLASLEKQSTPLAVALSNGKPSLMEFYADWCTSCQAMAGDIGLLEKQYGDKVNFVMLNVDNTKWLPEVLKYQVDGIPHFVFLAGDGAEIAQAIGKQPRAIMANNIEALVGGGSLPFAQPSGQVSKFAAPVTPTGSNDDPRLHGSQVVN